MGNNVLNGMPLFQVTNELCS